jgi:AraC-like DNA-binding protein
LWKPPVVPPARPLWFQSRVLEFVAEFFYPPAEEYFCDRQKRLARERMLRAKELLESRLAEPPSLEEISRVVGVSQFYLSRIFSQEMGMTIPQYLRQIRIQKAATLLSAKTHNVTEAAFAVGYSSLGHFSKNFCEVMGCCPTLYPQARNLRKT